MANYKKEDVLPRMKGQWETILSDLCGWRPESFNTRRHQACPVCGGKDRFRWGHKVAAKRDDGMGFCTQCGSNDGMKWFMLSRCTTFSESINEVGRWLFGEDVERRETVSKNIQSAKQASALPSVRMPADKCLPFRDRTQDGFHYSMVHIVDGEIGGPVNVAKVELSTGAVQFAAARMFPQSAMSRTDGAVSVIGGSGVGPVVLVSDYLAGLEIHDLLGVDVWVSYNSINSRQAGALYTGARRLVMAYCDDGEAWLLNPELTRRNGCYAGWLLYGNAMTPMDRLILTMRGKEKPAEAG